MRSIKKQLPWWRIVLIICVMAVAIPVTAGVPIPPLKASVPFQDDYWADRLERRLDYYEENENGDDADAKDDEKAGDDEDSEDDIYEQRREYWRDALEDEDW